MPDGSGVAGLQAPLVGGSVVAGDPTTLIKVVLQGPAQVLPADRTKYADQMPPFAAVFSDVDISIAEEIEVGHRGEVSRIPGDKRRVINQRRHGDQQVHGGHALAAPLERDICAGVDLHESFIWIGDRDSGQKGVQA